MLRYLSDIGDRGDAELGAGGAGTQDDLCGGQDGGLGPHEQLKVLIKLLGPDVVRVQAEQALKLLKYTSRADGATVTL